MLTGLERSERFHMQTHRLGHALWHLQALENTVAGYVVVRLRETRGIGVERATQVTAEAEGLTLGRLVGQLKVAGVMPGELATRLEALLEKRNWLVHHSWRETRGVLADRVALTQLLDRLDAIAADALALNKELCQVMEEYVVSAGVSLEFINAEADRLARQWGVLE